MQMDDKVNAELPCKISMVAYGAVDRIPHLRELPFRDAALVFDQVVIELDA
jgi:hypothetical protein